VHRAGVEGVSGFNITEHARLELQALSIREFEQAVPGPTPNPALEFGPVYYFWEASQSMADSRLSKVWIFRFEKIRGALKSTFRKPVTPTMAEAIT